MTKKNPVPAFLSGNREASRTATAGKSESGLFLQPTGTEGKDDLKWYLIHKYRTILIDKLTPGEFEQLRQYHYHQYDPRRDPDSGNSKKFLAKLREYVSEDILRQEIAGIEVLMTLMKPEDLRYCISQSVNRRSIRDGHGIVMQDSPAEWEDVSDLLSENASKSDVMP